MVRRFSLLSLAAGVALAAGCRLCDRNTQSNAGPPPCRLAGSARPAESCYDPLTGFPVSGGGTVLGPTTIVPGGGYPGGTTPRPDELPFPTPSDMIPRPGVPFAPPMPAPGDGLGANTKTGTGTPVKNK